MRKELEDRNKNMYARFVGGSSMQAIADEFGVTRQRVGQIVSEFEGGLADDDMRALHRARIEGWLGQLQPIIYGPPSYKVSSGTGQVVTDPTTGEPLIDNEERLKAIDIARKLNESARRLDALDLPRKKQLAEDEAMKRVKQYLASLPKVEVIDDEDNQVVLSGEIENSEEM